MCMCIDARLAMEQPYQAISVVDIAELTMCVMWVNDPEIVCTTMAVVIDRK